MGLFSLCPLGNAFAGDFWVSGGTNGPDTTSGLLAVDRETIVDSDGLRSACLFFFVGNKGRVVRLTGIRYSMRCKAGEQGGRKSVIAVTSWKDAPSSERLMSHWASEVHQEEGDSNWNS